MAWIIVVLRTHPQNFSLAVPKENIPPMSTIELLVNLSDETTEEPLKSLQPSWCELNCAGPVRQAYRLLDEQIGKDKHEAQYEEEDVGAGRKYQKAVALSLVFSLFPERTIDDDILKLHLPEYRRECTAPNTLRRKFLLKSPKFKYLEQRRMTALGTSVLHLNA